MEMQLCESFMEFAPDDPILMGKGYMMVVVSFMG